MTIAAEIRAEIGRKRLRRSELSTTLEISESTLWRKLTTETSCFRYDELQNIASALGIRLSELIRRAEENQEKEQNQQNEAKEEKHGNAS